MAAVCVLERMLLLDPERRVSASEALAMPFFSEFREPEEETEAQSYDHSMDNTDLPLEQWKRERWMDGWREAEERDGEHREGGGRDGEREMAGEQGGRERDTGRGKKGQRWRMGWQVA